MLADTLGSPMRVVLSITAGALLLGGCREPPGFACSSDDQCMSASGNDGVCFPIGACGYPDPGCASGYRYSGDAPKPWAKACVIPDDPGTTSSIGPTTTSAESTGDSSTGEASSSSTGPTPPECGNGVVELGELCDDGNDREADGCNPDCRPSGVLLFNFSSDLEGDDQAEAAMLTDDGDIVVAGQFGASGAHDGFVTRFRPDGAPVWTRTMAGSANRADAVWALSPSPDGGIRALGQVVNEVRPTMKKMMKEVTPREDFWLTEFDAATGDTLWSFDVGEEPPASERGYDMITLPEGDIVIAARVGDPSNSDFGIIRFSVVDDSKNGMTLNTVWAQTFDGGQNLRDFANAIAYDPAGRIVAGGTMEYQAADLDRHLRAIDLDGNPLVPPCEDLGGDDDLAADDRIFAVAVGPTGEVVAAGRATRETEESTDAWLGFYPPGSCALAWAETEPGPGQDADAFTTVAIDDLGNIVAGGFLNSGNTEDAWLAKYDTTGEQLWAIEPIDGSGNGNDRIEAVVIGPGREITVAGRMTRPGEDDTWVARYTP